MKFCNKHHEQLTGEGNCFVCEIVELRQVIEECHVEIKELKRLLVDNNIPLKTIVETTSSFRASQVTSGDPLSQGKLI
jgi:uncharacterized coiled-coil DUF342 family protein